MVRVTIDLLPGGDETRARTIGLVEIANIGGTLIQSNYSVVLKKTPPFKGALRQSWKSSKNVAALFEDADVMQGVVTGHHHTRRGVYDLLYRALRACGLDERNKPSAKALDLGPLSIDNVKGV